MFTPVQLLQKMPAADFRGCQRRMARRHGRRPRLDVGDGQVARKAQRVGGRRRRGRRALQRGRQLRARGVRLAPPHRAQHLRRAPMSQAAGIGSSTLRRAASASACSAVRSSRPAPWCWHVTSRALLLAPAGSEGASQQRSMAASQSLGAACTRRTEQEMLVCSDRPLLITPLARAHARNPHKRRAGACAPGGSAAWRRPRARPRPRRPPRRPAARRPRRAAGPGGPAARARAPARPPARGPGAARRPRAAGSAGPRGPGARGCCRSAASCRRQGPPPARPAGPGAPAPTGSVVSIHGRGRTVHSQVTVQ